MANSRLEARVEILERKMDSLEKLPGRVDALEAAVAGLSTQFQQFRGEVRVELSALNEKIDQRHDRALTRMDELHEVALTRMAELHELAIGRALQLNDASMTQMTRLHAVAMGRIDSVQMELTERIDGVGARIDGVGARIDGVGARLDSVGVRVDNLHADVAAGFGRLEKYLSGKTPRGN